MRHPQPGGRPGLDVDLLDHNAHADDVAAIRRELHWRLGPFMVVWGRSPIHDRSRVVWTLLARQPDVVCEE